MVRNFWDTLYKGELGELEFCFRKIPLHQQNFWWTRFFLIRLGCRDIWKMDQNDVTQHVLFAKQRCTLEYFVSVARWHEL